jgi:hypothetical protein
MTWVSASIYWGILHMGRTHYILFNEKSISVIKETCYNVVNSWIQLSTVLQTTDIRVDKGMCEEEKIFLTILVPMNTYLNLEVPPQ